MPQRWKKPKIVYRVVVECKDIDEDEGLQMVLDILEEDMSPDIMVEMVAFLDWIYTDWEIVSEEAVEIWSWADIRNDGKWHCFYSMYGDGADLHV